MATTRNRFSLAVAFAFLALSALPLIAGNFRTPIEARIADEFPFMARELASAAPSVADTRILAGRAVAGRTTSTLGLRAFLPDDISEPIVFANGSREVVLRASYAGVGVQRSVKDGAANERLLIDASSPRTIEYTIVSMRGIADVTSDGRSLRFISADRRAPDLVLSAPSLVDRSGAPSQRAAWSVGQERNGRIATVRLTLDTAMLHGSVLASFSARAVKTAAASSTGRSRLVGTPPVALTGGGTISGSLRDSATGNAIQGGLIHVYDSSGNYVVSAFSDQDGNYRSPDELNTGGYFVAALPYGYQPKLYNNISCPNGECPITSGTPVSVTHAEDTPNINFLVTSNSARVAGTVSNATTNAGLENVAIRFYNVDGFLVSSAFSNASGNYIAEMPSAGTFYAGTHNSEHAGYVDSLYNNHDCSGCAVTSGNTISASLGSITQNINFPLKANGGSITGNLTDSATTAGIAGETLYVYNNTGALAAFAYSDSTGRYQTFQGLATGNYYIAASPSGYNGEVYNNVSCPDVQCNPTIGTAIAVTLGATTANIDIALTSYFAQATGIVSDAANNNALADVAVVFYDIDGEAVAVGFSDATTGRYSVRLPDTGTYYARTFVDGSHATYVDELYNNIPCSNCNVRTGTAISATAGAARTNIDFALSNNGGSISGRLIDSSTASGIPGATINIYDGSGAQVSYANTDTNGNYTSATPLVSGNYYLVAIPYGYSWELYDNIACPNNDCIVTTGTAVAVTQGSDTPNINFTLAGNIGQLTGRVTSTASSQGIPNVTIFIYDSSGANVATATSDGNGDYSVALTQSGTYRARTSNGGQFIDELYDNISCPNGSCTISSGTGISVTVGSTTANINFALDPIVCPTIVITPDSLASGTAGTAYSDTVFASNGLSPYTFSLSDGDLPPGLTLGASDGVISGTPTASGSYGFTVTGKDANNCSGEHAYVIAVAGQPPTITNISPASGSFNGNTTVTITGTSFGNLQTVTFDTSTATIVSSTSTKIVVRTPAHAVGSVDVTVSTTDGNAIAPAGFTYSTAPNVTLTSSLNPSVYGNSVTFTATLNEQLASGTMTFYDGTTVLAVKPVVPGTLGDDTHPPTPAQPTTFTTSALTAGSHNITAVYSGDASYASATSNLVVQVVNKAARSVTLSAAPSPSTYGNAVTLTATVSPAAEATTVTFFDGANAIGTGSVNGSGVATFTTSALTAGVHSLTSSVAATANYQAATSNSVSHTVNKAARTLTLAVSPSPSNYGYPVTMTATLSVAGESTTVSFKDGATVIGTATTNASGVATFTTSTLALGAHTLSAVAAESANYLASTSNDVSHTVNKGAHEITVTASPSPSSWGATVTITATIFPNLELGTVTFKDGSTTIGTATANASGVATMTTSSLSIGTHSLTASTAASTSFLASTSPAVSLVVGKGNPAFTNLSAPTIVWRTAAIVVTGNLRAGSQVPVAGIVTLNVAGTNWIAAVTPSGDFTMALATFTLAPGSYTMTFTYPGNAFFNPATGTSTLTVMYNTSPTVDTVPKAAGATVAARVKLHDALTFNVSSSSIAATAYGVRLASSSTWLPANQVSGPPNGAMPFQTTNGGQYAYDLTTAGLAPGIYVFGYKAGNDPVVHLLQFTLQ